MKVVKIKVKYLLGILVVVILVSLASTILLPKLLYASAQVYTAIGQKDKANAIYSRLGLDYPGSPESVKSLYNRCAQQFNRSSDPLDFSSVYSSISSFGMSQTGMLIKNEDLEKINTEFYKIYKSAKHSLDLDKLKMAVALSNWFGGQTHAAIELMQDTSKSEYNQISEEAKLYLSAMYMQIGDYVKSRTIIATIESEHTEIKNSKTLISWYMDVLENKTQKRRPSIFYSTDKRLLVNMSLLISDIYFDQINSNTSGRGNIKGRVTMDEQPMKGVIVALTKVSIFEGSGIGTSSVVDYATTVSSDGSYSFSNIPEGDYFISVIAPWFILKDTTPKFNGTITNNRYIDLKVNTSAEVNIDFKKAFKVTQAKSDTEKVDISWAEYPNAAYYQISTGPIISGNKNSRDFFNATYSEITKKTQFTLNISKYQDTNMKSYIYSGGSADNKSYIDAQSILGSFYKGGKYGLSVTAYDSKGNALSTANAPNFSIKGSTASTADNLLMEGKYTQAIEEYEKLISDNPIDTHSIRVLGVLYGVGYVSDGTGKDLNKALQYFSRLNEVIPSGYTRSYLADIYLQLGDTNKSIIIYKEMIEKNDENLIDARYGLVKAYTYNGQFTNALKEMTQLVDSQISTYMPAEVYLINILQGEHDAYEQFINNSYILDGSKQKIRTFTNSIPKNQFDAFYNLVNTDGRDQAQKWLNSIGASKYQLFYKALLTMTIADKKEATKQLNVVIQELTNIKNGGEAIQVIKQLDRNIRNLLS